MKPVLQTITAAALAVVSVVTMAEERTGREFNELVRELNKELSEAKVKVRAIEAEHQAKSPKTEKKLLPERETAMRELSELSHDLKEARTDAEKQAAEQKVQDQILHVAELSTDFLERQKNELVNQDKQLAVMEDALSNVILKLDKLAAIAGQEADTADGKTEEERRVAARRELQGMARMVEMFAKKNPNSRHWRSVRQTIMLHDAVLRGNGQNGRKLQDILGAQKQMYEQTHAQIILARKAKVPIVPTVILGAYKAWPRHAKLPRPAPILVAYGERLSVDQIAARDDETVIDLVRGRILDQQQRYQHHPMLTSA